MSVTLGRIWIRIGNWNGIEIDLNIDSSIKDLEAAKGKLQGENSDLKDKMKKLESTHQVLQDEYQALQTASNSSDQKVGTLEKENDRLVSFV